MKKRSVNVRGHRTSLSLEDVFWDGWHRSRRNVASRLPG